ncbi:MAG: penicillin-binding protein 1C [Bacteroidota bacterium]
MMIKRILWAIAISGLAAWYFFSLPDPLFDAPSSTVLEDHQGRLLNARIAEDGQWRFPEQDSLPEKYVQTVLAFEDKRFFSHPGIDPFAIARAIRENISQKKIVSGASTLTMQVIRLSRKGKPRNYFQKITESALALRAELRYSKRKILSLYASHAPFGGNIVGLDAAAWRYFGVPPQKLSWGQTAALAVLPNAPSLIRPGKNTNEYLGKRNALLQTLKEREIIDSLTYVLSCEEPLPGAPMPLPQEATHLLNQAISEGKKGQRIKSTLSLPLQRKVNREMQAHLKRLESNQIHNAGAILLEVETGEVMAYAGNTKNPDNMHDNQVNMISAPRSSGSVLKPFLYAAMLQEGLILPKTLVADVPVNFDGYSPKNFSNRYDGVVHANEVLYRSLNVPMVRMLKQYGLSRFHNLLQKMDFQNINKPANHYGLSLILGGAETRLDELAGHYASMARILNHYNDKQTYSSDNIHKPVYVTNQKPATLRNKTPLYSASAIYEAFQALTHLERPEQESGWKYFTSSRKIAWKTGTSFGFRDAWAIGVTPEYVVAVWAGNADGEGRPGLTGLSAAAPLMMDLFRMLPPTTWFQRPWGEQIEAAVCSKSGHLAGPHCHPVDTVLIPENGIRSASCPYHQTIHLDSTQTYRVDASCYPSQKIIHKSWFLLPPAMDYYQRQSNPSYPPLPEFSPDCKPYGDDKVMEIIYPEEQSRIFIPTEMSGDIGNVVLKVAHRDVSSTLFWFIDQEYAGQTTGEHQIAVHPEYGNHVLTITDKNGNSISRSFEIVGE